MCSRRHCRLFISREKPLNKQFMFSLRNTVCFFGFSWNIYMSVWNEEENFCCNLRYHKDLRKYMQFNRKKNSLPSHIHFRGEIKCVLYFLYTLMKVVGKGVWEMFRRINKLDSFIIYTLSHSLSLSSYLHINSIKVTNSLSLKDKQNLSLIWIFY